MSVLRGFRAVFTGRVRQAVREFSGEADQEREARRIARQRVSGIEAEARRAKPSRELPREHERDIAEARRRIAERPLGRGGPPIIPPTGPRREPLPRIDPAEGPRTERERDRIEYERLPIWTTDGRIERIPARDLSSQERKSIVDYWLNVWAFLAGDQRDIGDWTGGAFQIEGHWIETSLDNIEDTADFVGVPLESDDLYQEI